jgi:hypothetical protein
MNLNDPFSSLLACLPRMLRCMLGSILAFEILFGDLILLFSLLRLESFSSSFFFFFAVHSEALFIHTLRER